jgi:hypothetical protein
MKSEKSWEEELPWYVLGVGGRKEGLKTVVTSQTRYRGRNCKDLARVRTPWEEWPPKNFASSAMHHEAGGLYLPRGETDGHMRHGSCKKATPIPTHYSWVLTIRADSPQDRVFAGVEENVISRDKLPCWVTVCNSFHRAYQNPWVKGSMNTCSVLLFFLWGIIVVRSEYHFIRCIILSCTKSLSFPHYLTIIQTCTLVDFHEICLLQWLR